MKHCLLFCAGGCDRPVQPIEPTDLVIAADGGLTHTQRLGITPQIILGDFDSLGYIPQGSQVFPVEKDDTDCMLAIRRGLAEGCDRFTIYGGLDGDRLDHTIANLQALHFLADQGATGTLVGLQQIVRVLRNGEMTLPAHFEGIFSLFCLGTDASGVTIRGAKYNLENGCLTAGFPLGVSNHFMSREVTVSVENGTLLLLWERRNGLA